MFTVVLFFVLFFGFRAYADDDGKTQAQRDFQAARMALGVVLMLYAIMLLVTYY